MNSSTDLGGCRSRSASSLQLLHQLGPPPFDGLQTSFQLPGLLVDVGQLFFELLLVQMVFPALFWQEYYWQEYL